MSRRIIYVYLTVHSIFAFCVSKASTVYARTAPRRFGRLSRVRRDEREAQKRGRAGEARATRAEARPQLAWRFVDACMFQTATSVPHPTKTLCLPFFVLSCLDPLLFQSFRSFPYLEGRMYERELVIASLFTASRPRPSAIGRARVVFVFSCVRYCFVRSFLFFFSLFLRACACVCFFLFATCALVQGETPLQITAWIRPPSGLTAILCRGLFFSGAPYLFVVVRAVLGATASLCLWVVMLGAVACGTALSACSFLLVAFSRGVGWIVFFV